MKRIFVLIPVFLVTVTLLFVTAMVGCGDKKNTAENSLGTPPNIVPPTAPQGDVTGDQPAPGKKVTVYSVIEDSNGNQSLQPNVVELPNSDTQTPASFALKSLITEEKSPLPKGTRLHSIKISGDGLATADFSQEFKDNFPGGDSAEALAINGIVSTLGQFKSVKNVQILVEGKKIDSLGGNQTLDEPLPVPQNTAMSGTSDKEQEPPGGGG